MKYSNLRAPSPSRYLNVKLSSLVFALFGNSFSNKCTVIKLRQKIKGTKWKGRRVCSPPLFLAHFCLCCHDWASQARAHGQRLFETSSIPPKTEQASAWKVQHLREWTWIPDLGFSSLKPGVALRSHLNFRWFRSPQDEGTESVRTNEFNPVTVLTLYLCHPTMHI